MKIRYYVLLGCLWLALGLLLSSPFLIPYLKGDLKTSDTVAAVDTSQPVQNEEPRISGFPSHIEFPAQNISVDVAPGYFNPDNQTWTLSNDKAHFATVTAEPNNKTGNTFIYGHNRNQVFTRLVDAQPGDMAIVTTTNGHVFTYKLTSVHDVDPHDTSMIQDHKAPIMTVQTCSGLWYENRRMFSFELVEAK